jgi:CubicO group peptidase (beta-lactamase class C family)
MPGPSLLPLPPQPEGVPWPTRDWPRGEPGPGVDRERLERALDRAFGEPQPEAELGRTKALLAVHHGRLVAERYAPEVEPGARLLSWSMSKSVLHAALGILARQGRLDLRSRAPVPAWAAPDDPRGAITVDQLLRMSDGLDFVEDYVDAGRSDVIDMLFGSGKEDVAGFAAGRPLAHAPDSVFNYSSGTSNVLAGIACRAIGGGRDAVREFLRRELFGPIGMSSAEPRFDAAGTWIASSFVDASARDFARFGLLYLRDGVWEGRAILPAGWVDYARTPTPAAVEEPYGAHWWLDPDGSGAFYAGGYRGQRILVAPALDLVLVRLGETPAELAPHLVAFVREVLGAFAGGGPG